MQQRGNWLNSALGNLQGRDFTKIEICLPFRDEKTNVRPLKYREFAVEAKTALIIKLSFVLFCLYFKGAHQRCLGDCSQDVSCGVSLGLGSSTLPVIKPSAPAYRPVLQPLELSP